MQITAQKIAELVGGELFGDNTVTVSGVAALDEALAYHLSYVISEKYLKLDKQMDCFLFLHFDSMNKHMMLCRR